MKDFELVTACTPNQLKRLRWSLPTWTIKPQFKWKKLHIFHHGFDNPEKDLDWIKEYFECSAHEWNMPNVTDQRELMLSAFVLGSGQVVTTDYFVKLDNDCYFYTKQDVFEEDDFNYSMCAHAWGYTKPAWWYRYLEAWSNGEPYNGPKDPKEKEKHSRIISFCCLHNTEFVRKCAKVAGGRLPIPSHDSYLWFMADRFEEFSWKSKNEKKLGVDHQSKEKGLRENICAKDLNWDKPFENIQLEITSQCNLKCHNCDRNCGLAKTDEEMSLRQILKFVQESHELDYKWNRIDIIGGEPTLHKDLIEIVDILAKGKRRKKIRLTTNGTNPEIIKIIPEGIKIRDSEKKSPEQKFDAVNLAPADFGYDSVQMCSIPWRCGLALSRYGYFLCGAGASIARVFGLDIGIKDLKDLTVKNLKKQRAILCRLCGHSRTMPKESREATTQQTSPLWEEAFRTYKDKELTLY